MCRKKKSKCTSITSDVKKRRRSLKKAPGAPKRFKSSYIHFFTSVRGEIAKELDSSAGIPGISKEASLRWKRLTPSERKKWDDKAKADKERFEREKAAYKGPWEVPNKRRKKDSRAPKRSMSAFLLFCKDHRQEVKKDLPKISSQEVSIELGKRWGDLSEKDKKPYKDREEIARAKYNKDIAAWRKNVKREVTPSQDVETDEDDLETTEKCKDEEETKEVPIADPETEEEACPEEDLLSLTRSTSSSEYNSTIDESFDSDDHQNDTLLDDELMDLENLFGDLDNIDDTLALTSSILQPRSVEKSDETAKPAFTLRPRPAATIEDKGGKQHYEGIQGQHSDFNPHKNRHPPMSPYYNSRHLHTSPYPPQSPYPPRSPYPHNVPSFHYPRSPYQSHYHAPYYPPPPFPIQVRSNIALSSNTTLLSPRNTTPVHCHGKRIQSTKERSASKDSIVSPRSVDEVPSMPVL
ncbi:HMG_box-domain-containing protein [Chaetoceros tenuissimus]|uniref:HMG_box-domain-containing protein n=1 Tax=Chaetoceros tenuissimus TaxID=426638 RepID=A0AAD3HDU1_9STRA|nr:HMG_box-domain-containing protein [Chaetoceros tenuissimus]